MMLPANRALLAQLPDIKLPPQRYPELDLTPQVQLMGTPSGQGPLQKCVTMVKARA
jgi:hypothetical protein